MEGILLKRGKLLGQWKGRYYVLSGHSDIALSSPSHSLIPQLYQCDTYVAHKGSSCNRCRSVLTFAGNWSISHCVDSNKLVLLSTFYPSSAQDIEFVFLCEEPNAKIKWIEAFQQAAISQHNAQKRSLDRPQCVAKLPVLQEAADALATAPSVETADDQGVHCAKQTQLQADDILASLVQSIEDLQIVLYPLIAYIVSHCILITVLDLGVTRPDLLECLVLASSIAFGIIVGALSMPLDCHSKVKRVVTVHKRADKSGDLKNENVPICPAAKTTASEFSGTAGERVDDCADTSLLEVERDAAAGRLSATLLADKGDDEAVPPITPFHSPATSPASASSSSSMPDAFPSSSISSLYSSLADTGLSPALVVPLPFGIKFAATMRRLEQKVLEILASPASPNDWMYEGMDSGVKIHSKTVSDVDSFFKREGAPTPAAPATPPVSSLSSSSSLLLARGEGTVCGLSAAQFMALIWYVDAKSQYDEMCEGVETLEECISADGTGIYKIMWQRYYGYSFAVAKRDMNVIAAVRKLKLPGIVGANNRVSSTSGAGNAAEAAATAGDGSSPRGDDDCCFVMTATSLPEPTSSASTFPSTSPTSASITAFDGYVPASSSYTRASLHLGGFIIKPLAQDSCQVYAMGLADLGGSIPGFIKKIVALKQPVMVKTVEKYYSTLCAKVKAWRQQQSKAGSKKCEESEEVRTLHKIHTVAAWFETQPVSLSTERE